MQWFRMYAEFATDPKVQSMSETLQRRYTMLLCLRCSENIPFLSDEEISCSLRISEEETTDTKLKLIAKGLIDESWNPVAWDKRQYISDTSTSRVQKFREKNKDNSNLDTDTEIKSLQKQKGNVSETFQKQTDDEHLSPLEQTMNDFREMRKKIKVPLTDRGEAIIRNKLNKMATTDEEKIEILEQSIVGCWKGLWEVKDKKAGGNNEQGVLRREHGNDSSTGNSGNEHSASKIPEGFWA